VIFKNFDFPKITENSSEDQDFQKKSQNFEIFKKFVTILRFSKKKSDNFEILKFLRLSKNY